MFAFTVTWIFLAPLALYLTSIWLALLPVETIIIFGILSFLEYLCMCAVLYFGHESKRLIVSGIFALGAIITYAILDVMINGTEALTKAHHYVTKWNIAMTLGTLLLFVGAERAPSAQKAVTCALYVSFPVAQTVLFLFWAGVYAVYSEKHAFSTVLDAFLFIPPALCQGSDRCTSAATEARLANILAHLIIPLFPVCMYTSYHARGLLTTRPGNALVRFLPLLLTTVITCAYVAIFVSTPHIYEGMDFGDSFGPTVAIIGFVFFFVYITITLEISDSSGDASKAWT